MRNLKSILFLILLSALCFNYCMGCNQSAKKETPQSSQTQNTDTNSSQQSNRIFTKAELSKYDGLNGNKAYVAIDGKVYDVSNNRQWHNGQHENYKAGTDLTQDMKNSPHGTRVLEGLPVVGNLEK